MDCVGNGLFPTVETGTYSSTSARDFHTVPFSFGFAARKAAANETALPIDGYSNERRKVRKN
jgi:hypothetical protein